MRNNIPHSTKLVSDRSLSDASVTSGISRELYNKLEAIAKARNLSKSAFIRELIIKAVDSAELKE